MRERERVRERYLDFSKKTKGEIREEERESRRREERKGKGIERGNRKKGRNKMDKEAAKIKRTKGLVRRRKK